MLGAAPLLLGIFGGAVLKQGVWVMLDGEDVAVAHQLDRELERQLRAKVQVLALLFSSFAVCSFPFSSVSVNKIYNFTCVFLPKAPNDNEKVAFE